MSERAHAATRAALRQADALLAWVLLGWLGQRLGWSLASGVLPVVVWWAVRCGADLWPGRRAWPLAAAAAALLASLTQLPTGPAALAALLLAAALWGGWSASLARAAGDTTPTLPGQAMGLMMGSLWLSSQWCLGAGWTDAQAVALHLALMTGLPPAVIALRARVPQATPPVVAALLVAGGGLMAGPDAPVWRVTAMVLLVLAWSLATPAMRTDLKLPAAIGPALLLFTGLLAPTQGPGALQLAWGTVAVLALWPLLQRRPGPMNRSLSPQRWSDAS